MGWVWESGIPKTSSTAISKKIIRASAGRRGFHAGWFAMAHRHRELMKNPMLRFKPDRKGSSMIMLGKAVQPRMDTDAKPLAKSHLGGGPTPRQMTKKPPNPNQPNDTLASIAKPVSFGIKRNQKVSSGIIGHRFPGSSGG